MAKAKVDIGHYVPKSYLRSFTYEKDKCCVYDKKTSKYYQSNVQNIMSERYFYDIPDTLISLLSSGNLSNVNSQFLEQLLGTSVDTYWSNIVGNISENYAEWFSIKYSWHYIDTYRCIAIQMLRTPRGREYIKNMYQEIYKKSISSDFDNVLLAREICEVLKDIPDSSLLDFLLNEFGHICIGLNDTNIPFITSDNPVVILDQYGERKEKVIYYPVTPKRCIFLRERKIIKSQLQNVIEDFATGKFKIKSGISDINLEAYNREKVLQAKMNPPFEDLDENTI